MSPITGHNLSCVSTLLRATHSCVILGMIEAVRLMITSNSIQMVLGSATFVLCWMLMLIRDRVDEFAK
jgi:hypothetical protein